MSAGKLLVRSGRQDCSPSSRLCLPHSSRLMPHCNILTSPVCPIRAGSCDSCPVSTSGNTASDVAEVPNPRSPKYHKGLLPSRNRIVPPSLPKCFPSDARRPCVQQSQAEQIEQTGFFPQSSEHYLPPGFLGLSPLSNIDCR